MLVFHRGGGGGQLELKITPRKDRVNGTLVRFSINIDVLALTLTLTKSLCLVLLRPAEASTNAISSTKTALLKELLFLALADILHKIN